MQSIVIQARRSKQQLLKLTMFMLPIKLVKRIMLIQLLSLILRREGIIFMWLIMFI